MLGVYALVKEAERPEKKRVLFLINQLFRGGAEIALINLLRTMDSAAFDVDLLVFDQLELPGSLSLLPEVPAWVNVVNAAEREGHAAFLTKAVFKIVRRLTGEQPQRRSAVRYLRGRYYDAAISYGEWFSSALAALYTTARRKYVWVHADMDKAAFLTKAVFKIVRRLTGEQRFSIPTFCAMRGCSTAFSSLPAGRWKRRRKNTRSFAPARMSFRTA